MNSKFPVVALGASAGGLEPLELFFEHTSNTSKYAFVIIQHLAPNHKSLMDELLSRHTVLPIHKIEHGMRINKGNIYLNPPKNFVEIKDGTFILIEKEDRKLSFPISDFFVSLSENFQDRACAIVLSGTGSDGSKGIQFIKENGGLVLVQDPGQAKFDGMPNNAIFTGVADKICNVEQMHQEIDAFFDTKKLISQKYGNPSTVNSIIAEILKSIDKQINVDFTGYKYTTVSRRISRRMGVLEYTKMEKYFDYLKNNQSEAQLLAKELLIGVTRFFRDEEAFNFLKSHVIPQIVKENRDSKTLRAWVPACSSGEEAYSIAILIKDYLRIHKLQFDVTIFATDLDKEAIKLAGNRVFSKNIGAEIPTEYLNTYFVAQKNGYTIAKEIREMIVFSVHNVIQDPPFYKIDLVSFRNLLIYLTDLIQQQLFTLFQYSLKTNGFLFLGPSETLGDSRDEFLDYNKKHNIYRNKENKKSIQRLHTLKRKHATNNENSDISVPVNYPIRANKKYLLDEIQHSLIQEYVPDSLVVDEHFNLLHSSGNAHRLLTLPSGEISSNVLKMLPDSIAVPLEVVANKVLQTRKPVELTGIEIPADYKVFFGSRKFLNLQVRKKELHNGIDYLFITFQSAVKRHTESSNFENVNVSVVSKEKIAILERELRINRETLQTTIEELESSNEELQATNEELQSSNEELESVNEELYTVNAEYQQKNHDLVQSNDDLNNLIQSSELPILFLDSKLNIRKFTPSVKPILDLVPHDIGRNISQFRGKIRLENILTHVESVLEDLNSLEFKIEDIKRKEYLLKISPFKSQKMEVQGVILVFIDLTQANSLKRAIEVSEKAFSALESKHENQEEIFELITNNLRDMVCILSEKGNIEYSSPSGVTITGFPLNELLAINFINRIAQNTQKEVLLKALADLQKNQEPGFIQFEFKMYDNSLRWLEASIKSIKQGQVAEKKYLLTIRDVHQRKLNEMEFQRNALIAEQTSSAVLIADIDGRINFANEAFEELTGYPEEEVLGKKPGSFLQGPETDLGLVELMSKSIKERKEFNVDIINYNKLGNKYLVNIKAEPLYDKENNFIGFFSIQNDITEQQNHIDQVQGLNKVIQEQVHKLEAVNKSLEEFAYIASHDLKAPLRNIKGLLEIIRKKGDGLDPEKRDAYFDVIISSSNEMNQMINNLLEYSRTGISGEKLELVDLPRVVSEAVQQFHIELEKLNGTINCHLIVEELEIYPLLFKRLIANLISNSLKYRSDKPPLITISNVDQGEKVLFLIEDNGIGIPSNQYDVVFQIFKSLTTNKDSNGIGLSVCKKIIELHEGSIWVESIVGKGTTIKFYIPKNMNYDV